MNARATTWAKRVLAAALVPAFSSCLYIPWQHEVAQGRGRIAPEATAFLQPGVTTREEVLLRFGEPEATLSGDRFLAYDWVVSRGEVCVVLPYGTLQCDDLKHYQLMVCFDDAGKLVRWENTEGGSNPALALRKWARKVAPEQPRRTSRQMPE